MIGSLVGGVLSAQQQNCYAQQAQSAQMEMQRDFLRYKQEALRNVAPSSLWRDALTSTQVEVPASRIPRENCRNCGAPTTSCGCDYCGTP
jgi:hypothetical protein